MVGARENESHAARCVCGRLDPRTRPWRASRRPAALRRAQRHVLATLAAIALLATLSGCTRAGAGPGAQPARIVSTSPSITEILYELGLGDRVVGVTTYCHYPPEAAKKPKIGDFLHPNLERIVGLRPDLVISESTGVRGSVQLTLPALEVRNGSVAEILEAIDTIGRAAGVPDRAERLAARIRSDLGAISERTARLKHPRVMFVAGRTPGRVEDIVVAGRGSHLDELIGIAGGVNVFRDTVSNYSKISLEALVARNPEVIIDMGEMADTAGVTEAQKRAVAATWAARMPMLAAVRNRRVYAVASDIYVVPGPRIVEAAREFARMLHPGAGF
jgi:iron complex transport system substrate-binding protein